MDIIHLGWILGEILEDMLKCIRKLTDIKDRFGKVYIFGSGPTDFDYQEISRIEDPVFFVNDMAQFSSLCPSSEQYFFSHHLHKYQEVSPITIYIEEVDVQNNDFEGTMFNRYVPKNTYLPVRAISRDVVYNSFFNDHTWLLDKEEVIRRNTVVTFCGTISTVIYFLWFVGCKEAIFVGCNPKSLTDAHDSRIGGSMIYEADKIRHNQLKLTEMLSIKAIYL